MIALQVASWRTAIIFRWTARIAGTLIFLLFLAFFFGEGPPHLSNLTATERLHFLGVAALFLGLPIAWKWEGLGGLMGVAGFAFLVAVRPTYLPIPAFYIPAIVGAVHVACWARLRIGAPAGLAPWRLPRSVVLSFVGALAVFLLLFANEIFGRPPLMTPALHPGAELVGAWHGVPARVLLDSATIRSSVDFVVHPDCSVTGNIGDAELIGGRVVRGRSWFGEMLHINVPYIVTGKLSRVVRLSEHVWGDEFVAPLEPRGRTLSGSLFLHNQPTRLVLTRQ